MKVDMHATCFKKDADNFTETCIYFIMCYCMDVHLIFRLFQYYRWIATKENSEHQTKQPLMQLKSDFKQFIKLLTMKITYTTF